MTDLTSDMPTITTTTTEDMENENGFSSPLLTFAAVMTFLIMFVGICGNFLTVMALLKCPKVRNVAAAFIISLCIADLLFCVFVLPFNALRFLNGNWTHGEVLCKLIPFIQYGNVGVSLLCIGMITINRYVMIAHHSSYGRIYTKHWIAAMIAFCWIFSYGMQLPTLFAVWGTFDYDAKLGTCSIMSDSNGRSSKTALFIIAFIIPCLIIIACYTKIFWVVHKSEVRLKKHATKQNSIPNNLRAATASSIDNAQSRVSATVGSDSSYSTDTKQEALQKPTRVKDQREVRAKRNEWRITKMVLAIFLSFVLCYLPITIVKIADKDVEHPGLQIFSYLMLYMSACINPIIYVIMNKQYRKAYKTVIMCEPSRLLPFAKGLGGSSAAEKWKDTGLSNNHSRTMVSQMSQVEPPNTSRSSSFQIPPQQPTTIELMNKSQLPMEMDAIPPKSLLKQNTSTAADSTTLTAEKTMNNNNPNIVISQPRLGMNRDTNRIALVGGDIILEEEEVGVMDDYSNISDIQSPVLSPSLSMMPQKKIQSYGQNINVIPDNNNEKLFTKLKL